MNKNGLVIPQSKPNAELRLIVFPYAGGQAQNFFHWDSLLENNIELICLQYPGRGSRSGENLITDIKLLSEVLFNEITTFIEDEHKPYIFFGHSFGARLAFEILHKVKSNSKPFPIHFIASAGKAPHTRIPTAEPKALSRGVIAEKMRKLGGTPSELIDNAELFEYFLPIIQADLTANDQYFRAPHTELNCPATVMGGKHDNAVELEHLLSWQEHFSNPVDFQLFDGNHFFINSHTDSVLENINCIANKYLYT